MRPMTLLALPFLIGATSAPAQEVNVYSGVALTSEYVSSGLKQSDGSAFQPYVELDVNGFYAGVWASNTDGDLLGAEAEVDLYVGYRNEVGNFSYDLGYARYYYIDPDDDCCGEIYLSMGYALGDTVGVGLYLGLDPDTDLISPEATAAIYLTDRIALAALYGRSAESHSYGSVGGSYALSDTTALDLTVHDSTIDESIAVLSLTMDFSLH